MDIFSIISEPGAPGDWLASYRPLTWVVQADSAVPPDQPMYADVYVGDPAVSLPFAYYKTFTSYTIESLGGFGLYTFDIQDALQEYIKFYIPAFNNTISVQQSDAPVPLQLIQVVVYFRGSTIASGILTPNPTVPTQGTATTAPVSTFSGTASSTFTVVNATLNAYYLTITDNDLQGYLRLRQVTDSAGFFIPGTDIVPLSDLPLQRISLAGNSLGSNLNICPENYRGRQGMFPIMTRSFGVSGMLPTDMRNCSVYIMWGPGAVTVFSLRQIVASQLIFGDSTYYLPLGLLEMSLLMIPSDYANLINPNNNSYYRVALLDDDSGKWCFFSPLYKVMPTATQCEVLWFQNNYGHFEQASFVRTDNDFNTTSTGQFTPYNIIDNSAVGTLETDLRVGHRRYNVRSYDTISLTATVNATLLPWLKELFRSGYILQEMPKGPGFSFILNNNQLFRAIMIIDGTFKIVKTLSQAGEQYTITVKIRPAIDNINLRN